MARRFTLEEIQIIRDNYPVHGGRWCADALNMPIKRVTRKAVHLNLRVNDSIKRSMQSTRGKKYGGNKPSHCYRVDFNCFLEFTPTTSYLLGLLWADGYVLTSRNRIAIEVLAEDSVQIESLFSQTGKWTVQERTRSGRKKQRCISTHNKYLCNLLCSWNYNNKKLLPPILLNYLPSELLPHWLRGYFDGDGCLYTQEKHYLCQCSFAGHYDQDWEFLSKICQSLAASYRVIKSESKKGHRHSRLLLCGKNNVRKLLDYIYTNSDGIRLKRKHDKYITTFPH